MAEKKVVYTDEVVARMSEAYLAADSDESRATVVNDFADELGVPVQSVRAKLVNLQIYVAKERTTKTGEAIESKAQIVAEIAKALNQPEDVIDSLEKATKPVLKLLRAALTADKNSEAA